MEIKNSFLAANTLWVWCTQKVPHVYNLKYFWIFNVVGRFFCWRSLFRYMALWILSNF